MLMKGADPARALRLLDSDGLWACYSKGAGRDAKEANKQAELAGSRQSKADKTAGGGKPGFYLMAWQQAECPTVGPRWATAGVANPWPVWC